jgi:transposase
MLSLIVAVVEARSHNREAESVVNDTSRLLGLEGVVAAKLIAMDESAGGGLLSGWMSGPGPVRIAGVGRPDEGTGDDQSRDLPVGGRTCRLRWRKRRWHGDQRECPRRAFTEQVEQILAGSRLTLRLRRAGGGRPSWKEQITHAAIDLCTIFKAAVRAALPNAVLAVDHFHVVQLANTAVTEVRRRLTVQVRGRVAARGSYATG